MHTYSLLSIFKILEGLCHKLPLSGARGGSRGVKRCVGHTQIWGMLQLITMIDNNCSRLAILPEKSNYCNRLPSMLASGASRSARAVGPIT